MADEISNIGKTSFDLFIVPHEMILDYYIEDILHIIEYR